ncbi:MAG: M12 family metallo-peptidase [Filomicrobium sp.]
MSLSGDKAGTTRLRTIAARIGSAAVVALLAAAPLLQSSALAEEPRQSETNVSSDDQARFDVVLSNLPPRDSMAYRYLQDIAGAIRGEKLTMSKSEMWSIDPSRADMLMHAANEQGIEMTEVGAQSTKILSLGSQDGATPNKEMLDRLQSEAVMSVTMMDVKRPAMLEYALSRGDKPVIGNRPTYLDDRFEIQIPLPNGQTIKAERYYVESTKEGCFWHGKIQGSKLPVSLMWWPEGGMAGSFQHDGRNYVIRRMKDKTHAVIEMAPEKMPPEHPQAPRDFLKQQGEMLRNLADAKETSNELPAGLADLPLFKNEKKKKAEVAKEKSEAKAGDTVISVLFLTTKKVAEAYSNVRQDLVALAVEQTNQSFRASKIDGVRVEVADVLTVDYDETGGNHFNHLWRMADRGDAHLEDVHELRNKHRADIVMLIVDSPTGCGLATRVAADAHEAFAVVHHECATTTFSVAHEIGHLIGARHDRALDKSTRPFPFGHGYVNATKWRTMMSYKASCEGCPRLPVWSNPNVEIDGDLAGDPDTHNARVIAEQAARVSRFR